MNEYESNSITAAMQFYKPITLEKTIKLARIMRGDDESAARRAREALMASNYALCADIATKWYRKHNTNMRHSGLDDVFQAAILGLIRAVDKYDPDSGYHLTTYSYRWIESFVQRFCYDNSGAYRIPSAKMASAHRTDEDNDAIESSRLTLSMSYENNGEDSDSTRSMIESVEDESAHSHKNAIINADDEAFWKRAEELCTPTELRCIKMRADGATVEDIAKVLGSEPYAVFGQIERGALKATGRTASLF